MKEKRVFEEETAKVTISPSRTTMKDERNRMEIIVSSILNIENQRRDL